MTAPTTSSIYSVEFSVIQSPPVRSVATPPIFLSQSLIPCVSVSERNLLADTARIVEANKNLKQKDDLRKMVTDGLQSLGYDSFTCKSKWEKLSSFPAEKKTKDKHKSKHHKGDRLSKIWELRERQRIVSMDTYQNLNQWQCINYCSLWKLLSSLDLLFAWCLLIEYWRSIKTQGVLMY